MDLTSEELEQALIASNDRRKKLESMMRNDGWTVYSHEENPNIAAINPSGREYKWTHWEHLDGYICWKIKQIGYIDCTMHKAWRKGEVDEKFMVVRSPISNRIFSFYDWEDIITEGKEPEPKYSTGVGVQLTVLYPEKDITDFYVNFNNSRYHRITKQEYIDFRKD